MLSLLKQFLARLRSRLRGGKNASPLIDREALEQMLERSKIPAVLMLVLVWTISSVLLIISRYREYRPLHWKEGQPAAYSYYAGVDFNYVDSVATELKRDEARRNVPDHYRLDDTRVSVDADAFFKRIKVLAERQNAAKPGEPAKNAEIAPATGAAALADRLSPETVKAIDDTYWRRGNSRLFNDHLKSMLARGIVGSGRGDVPIRIVGKPGVFNANTLETVDGCAGKLAEWLLSNGTDAQRAECRKVLKELIGEEGNLTFDAEFTAAERRRAADSVRPVEEHKSKGALLIGKDDIYTKEIREMIAAERAAAPKSDWVVAYRQTAWSSVLLLTGVLAICMISKSIRQDNLRILLAGITVSLALAFNYYAIKIFYYLLRNNPTWLSDERLLLAALPAAFCAVVLAAVLDVRSAICAGGFVAVVSAMMVDQSRALELALRWTAISTGAAMIMRNVGNYRSFFVRALLGVLITTWALSLDVVFYRPAADIPAVLKSAAWIIPANAALCAMLGLLTIFVMELVFNLSTDMALMVLSDCNHPVLERLKREAPGTMAHAMAVATISEDAARAIGANPVRAKAGALFHDIGKLTNPQYFTENNPDSSLLHAKLKPEKSSRIILAHVTDGVELARQYRLCHFIRSVISTHHGDDLVRFFYFKAQEEAKQTGKAVNEAQFRYQGPPPANREEGIISLADACEAASRSLKDPTPEKIAELVGNIIQGRFRDGMLRESRLTAKELDQLRTSFIATLSSIMHGRIAYPGGAAPGGDKKC